MFPDVYLDSLHVPSTSLHPPPHKFHLPRLSAYQLLLLSQIITALGFDLPVLASIKHCFGRICVMRRKGLKDAAQMPSSQCVGSNSPLLSEIFIEDVQDLISS